MDTFDEVRAKQALVRVHGKGTVGTGFFFDEAGLVMTCHHVVDGADSITVEDATGQATQATFVDEMSAPDLDVAVLRVAARAPMVLPLGSAPKQPEKVWTSGFQLQSANVRGPLPATPTIDGTTDIAYRHRREYIIPGVLRISGGIVSAGLSGAPVVVLPEGVAIGIATADFDKGGGFAVPVNLALDSSASLREHARVLEERVPAFGRYLNAAAARSLCDAQVRHTLSRMSDLGQFLPEKYVERRKLHDTLEAFRRSPRKIFPVVGVSGIGKTNALAATAQSTPPAIFLPAYRANFSDRGLAATLASELGRFSTGAIDPARVVGALARSGSPLLVILDGLNEATALANVTGRAWLDDTFDWVKTRPVQLVVTSRIEFWSLIAELFPSNLLYVPNENGDKRGATESSTFELRPFEGAELRDAATAYELSADAAEDKALRHPLLIRLYWELGTHGERVGMYALFERFVEDRSQKVSRALGGSTSPKSVQHALAIAARLADPKTLTIPADRLIEALLPFNNIRETLLSENVLVEAANGYRFIFDEVADFLMSQERELPRGVEAWKQLLGNNRDRPGWLRFALLRLERTAPENLPGELRAMIGEFERQRQWPVAVLIQQAITAVQDPRPLIPVILELARAVANTARNERYVDFGDLARYAKLSGPQRLQIARHFLPGQHYYEWEEKHWRDLSSGQFFARLTPSHRLQTAPAIVTEALIADYQATIAVLFEWLDDETPLSDNNGRPTSTSHMNDLARAFIFHSRDDDFSFVCSLAAERAVAQSAGAKDLFRLLATYDGEALLPFVETWAAREETRYDDLAISVLGASTWPQSDGWTKRAEQVLDLVLRRRISEYAVANALAILSRRPHLAASAFDELLSRFINDDPLVSGYALRPYVATHFDTLLEALGRYLDGAHSRLRRHEALYALNPPDITNDKREKVAAFLSRVLTSHPELSYPIARVVEDVLNVVETPSGASDAFFSLAKRILVESDESARQAALYGVCATDKESAKSAAQDFLIDDLCTGDYPNDLLLMLLNELSDSRYRSDAEMQRIHRLAARLDGVQDGESLINCAIGVGDFGEHLAKWLGTRSVRPDSPAEKFLRYIREENMKAHRAAQTVCWH